jgi:hypothetical protein
MQEREMRARIEAETEQKARHAPSPCLILANSAPSNQASSSLEAFVVADLCPVFHRCEQAREEALAKEAAAKKRAEDEVEAAHQAEIAAVAAAEQVRASRFQIPAPPTLVALFLCIADWLLMRCC